MYQYGYRLPILLHGRYASRSDSSCKYMAYLSPYPSQESDSAKNLKRSPEEQYRRKHENQLSIRYSILPRSNRTRLPVITSTLTNFPVNVLTNYVATISYRISSHFRDQNILLTDVITIYGFTIVQL